MVLPARDRPTKSAPPARRAIVRPVPRNTRPEVRTLEPVATPMPAPQRSAAPRAPGRVSQAMVVAPRLKVATADLAAAAFVARQHLFGGAPELARLVYDGLTLLAPDVAVHHIGLALALDLLGEADAAIASYRRAAALDPKDATPDLNVAELHLSRGELSLARPWLRSALAKATTAKSQAHAEKARALIAHIDRL